MISESQMKSAHGKERNLWIFLVLQATIFFSQVYPVASQNQVDQGLTISCHAVCHRRPYNFLNISCPAGHGAGPSCLDRASAKKGWTG